MPIIGNIIKSAIEFTDKVIPETSPVENQKDVLRSMLKKARKTAFGKKYQFDEILKQGDPSQAFSDQVPYHDYNKMYEEWWKHQLEGEANVSWPGVPEYYALSSGTTGNVSKRIPVSNEMLDAIRKTGMMQVLSLSHFNLPSNFYEKEIMMLGSTTGLLRSGNHLEGEISGISAKNIPQWFKGYYRPGDKISAIQDWDERLDAIVESASEWDIGALCGIPSWNEIMLKKIIAYYKVKNIHEIWPNLSIFASGGVAFEPYRKSFDALMGREITVLDTYLASEGFLAYQARPNPDMAMCLAHNSGIYFEFVPFINENIDENGNVRPSAKSLNLQEVDVNTDYVLVISTVSGAWRYMIGDTVRFTNKEKAEIIISGRTQHFLNVVGSQLSVLKMNETILFLEEKFNINILEFTVAAVKPGEDYFHHWYLGVEGEADENHLAESIDEYLKENHKNYKVARSKALTGLKASIVPPDVFYKWNENQNKKGGQAKMPRVMKEVEFNEWQAFTTAVNES